jgi:hypothetical protein
MTRVEVWPEGWNAPLCLADCHAKNAPETETERVANAAFIVRACNSFDSLLAACERMVECADKEPDGCCVACAKIARAAIKLARGEA